MPNLSHLKVNSELFDFRGHMKSDHMGEKHLRLKMENLEIFENYYRREMSTDYGHPVRKSPSLSGRKSNPNPKFLGMAEAYFVTTSAQNFRFL